MTFEGLVTPALMVDPKKRYIRKHRGGGSDRERKGKKRGQKRESKRLEEMTLYFLLWCAQDPEGGDQHIY